MQFKCSLDNHRVMRRASSKVVNYAPAGRLYQSIELAGCKQMQYYHDSLPNTSKSFILPLLKVTQCKKTVQYGAGIGGREFSNGLHWQRCTAAERYQIKFIKN